MNPFLLMAMQALDALGLTAILQGFVIAVLGLAVLFMGIRYFTRL